MLYCFDKKRLLVGFGHFAFGRTAFVVRNHNCHHHHQRTLSELWKLPSCSWLSPTGIRTIWIPSRLFPQFRTWIWCSRNACCCSILWCSSYSTWSRAWWLCTRWLWWVLWT